MNVALAADRVQGQTIPERFEEIVARYPDSLAVKCTSHSRSYRELNQEANRVARALLDVIAAPDNTSVALLFDHGFNVIPALLGALKAGMQVGALDAHAPEERMKFIVEDCHSSVIVTETKWLAIAQRIAGSGGSVLNVDDIDPVILSENLNLPIPLRQRASITYTSGSTGMPQRVAKTHQETTVRAISTAALRQISPVDRLSLLHAVGFAAGRADLFSALLNGAAIFPFDIGAEGVRGLIAWLKRDRITVFHSPPAVWRELENIKFAPDDLPDLRLVRLTGSAIVKRDFEFYTKRFSSNTLFEVGMGSTEIDTVCNGLVNHDFVFPEEGSPIGYAREERQVVIIDDDGREQQPGEIGMIAVRSREFTVDFCRQRNLPKSKFLRDPKDVHALIYLTGDMGTMSSDGFVVHLGRKDLMLKIRGFRVEISEIERALLSHPMVKEAGVVAWDRPPAEKYLVGYVVARRPSTLTVSALRAFLWNQLPDYMVPATFVFLESLPLTNGKVNRRALPEPDHVRPELGVRYVAPRNDLERRLVALWEEILDVSPIGVDDDFFDLGGYSLLGTRLIAEIKDHFQTDLPLPLLGEQPTIAQLAVHIARVRSGHTGLSKKTQNYNYLVKLQSAEGTIPVICLSHAGNYRGDLLRFAQLNRLIGAPFCFYGIQARGADGASQPHGSVEQMAAAYVEEIQALNPHGPHYLIGECGAAPIAYETARQLQARRENVVLLVLLDASGADPDGRGYFWRSYIWYRYFPWLCYPSHAMKEAELNFKRRVDRRLPKLPWLRGKQRLKYLFGHWKQIAELVHSRPAAPGVDAEVRNGAARQTLGSGKRSVRSALLYPLFRMARLRYHYLPYTGRIAVIVNERWYDADPTLDWPRAARGGLEVHRIPGDHDNYITQNVGTVARVLRDCLQRAASEKAA